jgi:hypothetical protein
MPAIIWLTPTRCFALVWARARYSGFRVRPLSSPSASSRKRVAFSQSAPWKFRASIFRPPAVSTMISMVRMVQTPRMQSLMLPLGRVWRRTL